MINILGYLPNIGLLELLLISIKYILPVIIIYFVIKFAIKNAIKELMKEGIIQKVEKDN